MIKIQLITYSVMAVRHRTYLLWPYV